MIVFLTVNSILNNASICSFRLFILVLTLSIRLFPGDEFIFKDQWGGISLMNASSLVSRPLMSNQTYVGIYVTKLSTLTFYYNCGVYIYTYTSSSKLVPLVLTCTFVTVAFEPFQVSIITGQEVPLTRSESKEALPTFLFSAIHRV